VDPQHRREYKVPQDFFGTASTPLIEGNLLIVNVGAPGGPCVVGLDKATGREVWRAGKEWGPSYASPVPAVVQGSEDLRLRRRRVHAADRRPALDRSGEWPRRLLVPVAQPLVRVGQRVVSRRLRQQGVRVGKLSHGRRAARDRPDFTHRVVWTTQEFGLHFNTPIYKNGFLYGFDGRNEPDASLACVDAASGKVVWRTTPNGRKRSRPAAPSVSNCSVPIAGRCSR
jgi:hypothetical protein